MFPVLACLGPACWHSFVSSPTRAVFEHPETTAAAWAQVTAWLECSSAWVPQPTERHAEVLGGFLTLPGVHGNLVPDAHIAALAIEHGLTLCSADSDFARFPGLAWSNPLTT